MQALKFLLVSLALVYLLPAALAAAVWCFGDHPGSWRDADWSSAGILPPASASREAAVYVLAARTGGFKGAFADHSWIVLKDAGGPYERWDVVGWGTPVRRNTQPPDGRWYSNTPGIVAVRKGPTAEQLIPKIRQAIHDYPYGMSGGYQIFPGPNSNSFIQYVLETVPGLDAVLPSAAVGRDYPIGGRLLAIDPDRLGFRLSLFGYAGINASLKAGLEVNLLGLVAGIDPLHLAIKIPAFGTYGLAI